MRVSKSNKRKKSPPRTGRLGSPGSKASQKSPTIGAYRFSDEFINRGTTILCVSMVGMIGGGFLLGYVSDNFEGETRDIFSIVGLTVAIAGITLPLLIAGILGGEAIMRGAGVLGFLLVMGLFACAVGGSDGSKELLGPVWAPWAFWGGIAAMVIGGAGFWIVGWIAKVPMWIQGPELGSPRAYVRGPGDKRTRHQPGA